MFLDDQDRQEDAAGTLGERIIHAREQQGLTTAQLARRLGVKSSTLQEWESDRSAPRSNRLITLAGVLSVSPTWLLMGYGERPGDTLTADQCHDILELGDWPTDRIHDVAEHAIDHDSFQR